MTLVDAPTNHDGDDDDVSREETDRQTPLLIWKALLLAIHDAIIIADNHLVLEGCTAAADVAIAVMIWSMLVNDQCTICCV